MALHGIGAPLIVLICCWAFRRHRARIAESILSHKHALAFLKVFDKIAAVVSGVLVTFSLKHDWTAHPIIGMYMAMCAVGFLAAALSCTWLAERAGDKKSGEIAELRAKIEEMEKASQEQAKKLALAKQTAAVCNTLVERKVNGLKKAAAEGAKGLPWDPRTQALTILQLTHKIVEQWLVEYDPAGILRLGVYLPSQDGKQMELQLAWNGTDQSCYHSHPNRMLLVHPSGKYSVVVRTWHEEGNSVLNLIGDTASAPGFEFWCDNQKEHLRSIAAFKFKITTDGIQNALVLEMDTGSPGFFDESRREPLTALLTEMLRRFEFELLCASLNAQKPHAKEVTLIQ